MTPVAAGAVGYAPALFMGAEMAVDINTLEGMPDPPEGYKWKMIVRFGSFFRVVAVRERWPHFRMNSVEGVVLYELRNCGTPPPDCIIRAADRFLLISGEEEENERRKRALREYR